MTLRTPTPSAALPAATAGQSSAQARSWRGAPAAARTVLALLDRLTHGSLHVQWPDGSHTSHGQQGDAGGTTTRLRWVAVPPRRAPQAWCATVRPLKAR